MGLLSFVRWGLSVAIVSVLLFYLVPLVPVANLFPCSGAFSLCLGNPSGLVSLSYTLVHWGGIYSYELGYVAPEVAVRGAGLWIPVGWFSLIPVACVLIGLLSPEVVDGADWLSTAVSQKLGR